MIIMILMMLAYLNSILEECSSKSDEYARDDKDGIYRLYISLSLSLSIYI